MTELCQYESCHNAMSCCFRLRVKGFVFYINTCNKHLRHVLEIDENAEEE